MIDNRVGVLKLFRLDSSANRAFAVERVCRSNKGTSKTCIVVSISSIFYSFSVVFLSSRLLSLAMLLRYREY